MINKNLISGQMTSNFVQHCHIFCHKLNGIRYKVRKSFLEYLRLSLLFCCVWMYIPLPVWNLKLYYSAILGLYLDNNRVSPWNFPNKCWNLYGCFCHLFLIHIYLFYLCTTNDSKIVSILL